TGWAPALQKPENLSRLTVGGAAHRMERVGLLKRLLVPRPVRRATRVVRHPVSSSISAVTPRPIRQARRAIYNVANPVEWAESAVENSVVHALRTDGTPTRQ